MGQLRISVAMCTYNGARHLSDQLDSICRQTLLPDELIICDDNSTDQTPEILRNFVAEHPCLFAYSRMPRGWAPPGTSIEPFTYVLET